MPEGAERTRAPLRLIKVYCVKLAAWTTVLHERDVRRKP